MANFPVIALLLIFLLPLKLEPEVLGVTGKEGEEDPGVCESNVLSSDATPKSQFHI